MKFAGVLMIVAGALAIMFTVRKPPAMTTGAAAAAPAIGGVASGVGG